MSLEVHFMANQIERQYQEARRTRVRASKEAFGGRDRHPAVMRFGAAVSRLGHRLQGIPAPAAPELRHCPECGIATW
jgi:hypothetical protein